MHERTSSRRRTFGTGSIALSLGLCLCAGTLSAPQVAVAAPVTAAAAAAPARSVPKMTQKASRGTITSGSTVKLTTRVLSKKTGKAVSTGKVRLQGYRGGWKTWATQTVSKSGTISIVAKPSVTTSYRMVYLGNTVVRSGISNAVRITVKPSGAKVLTEAARHKGALYKYGAAGPTRFDCSGFTLYVYKKTTGRKLPHKANSQQRYGRSISKGSKKAGDLIVFRSGSYGYHAAVYAGNGYMYDSPRSGARVSKRKMFSSNYVVRRLV